MGKKTIRKLLAVFAALVLTVSLAGCGNRQDELDKKDPDVLKIRVWVGGYGDDWVKSLADAYMAKHEEITVKVEPTTLREKVGVELTATPKDYKYDIILSDCISQQVANTPDSIPGLKHAYHDLGDVFDYVPEGESKSIAEKMYPGAADYFTSPDGGRYILSVATTLFGFIYNTEVFASAGIKQLPRTTKELEEVAIKLKNAGYYPFVYGGDTDYWDGPTEIWWMQYQGAEAYKNFYSGRETINGRLMYTPEIFKQKGRLYALQATETFLSRENGYCDPDSAGYLYMDAQNRFMQNKDGKYRYGMMSNGVWLENEMREFYTPGSVPLAFMKTPVLSDVVYADRTKDKNLQTPVMTEQQLRETVDYVDGVRETPPAGVTEEGVELVRNARGHENTGGLGYTAVLPGSSPKSELAKDFLKFMFSNEGTRTYVQSTKGNVPPVEIDFAGDETYSQYLSGLTPLNRSMLELLSDCKKFYRYANLPINYTGGLSSFRHNVITAFGSKNPADRMTAREIYDYDYNYYTSGNTWQDLLTQSGIQ